MHHVVYHNEMTNDASIIGTYDAEHETWESHIHKKISWIEFFLYSGRFLL
jgi:hypothetical protein